MVFRGATMMKKALLVFLFGFFALAPRAYSFEPKNNISLGVLGIGFSADEGGAGLCFAGDVVRFSFPLSRHLGITATPFRFTVDHSGAANGSFLNLSFFYNILAKEDNVILGPFASVNALHYYNPASFEFHTGLTFSLRNINFTGIPFRKDSIFGSDFLVIELGYTYHSKKGHGFYISAGMDILTTLFFVAGGEVKDTEEYKRFRKEHPEY
jgi:hypothetical protein